MKTQPENHSRFKTIHKFESFYSGGAVCYSKDYFITSNGADISLSHNADPALTRKIEGDSDIITAMALQGNILISASRSLQLSIFDLSVPDSDGGVLSTRIKSHHQAPVLVMDLHTSQCLLATGSADSHVRIFDLRSKACSHVFKASSLVSSVKIFDMDDLWLVCAGCEDGRIFIWDLNDKKRSWCVPAHSNIVRSLAFHGWSMLSAARDSIVSVWDIRSIIKTKSKDALFTIPVFESVENAGFIDANLFPFGSSINQDYVIFTSGEKGMLKLWDMSSGRCIHSLSLSDGDGIPLVHTIYDLSSQTILTVDAHQVMNIISIPQMAIVGSKIGTMDEILDLKFVGPFGNWLAVGSTSENFLLLDLGMKTSVDLNTKTGGTTILKGHSAAILCVDGDSCDQLVPQGSSSHYLLASGSKDNNIKIWLMKIAYDANGNPYANVRHLADCFGHVDAVSALSLSRPNDTRGTMSDILTNRYLYSAGNDRTLKKWDLNGLLIEVEVLEAEVGKVKTEWTVKAHEKDINSIHVSNNGKFIATASQDRTIKLWTSQGKEIAILKGHRRGVWNVRFSPCDKYVISGSGDQTIKIWSTSEQSCLKTLEGHSNSVLRVEPLPLGGEYDFIKSGTIVSTGSDGLTKLWSVRNSECMQSIDNHDEKVWALAVRNVNSNESSSATITDMNSLSIKSPELSKKCIIASGAADASIALSVDITQETLVQLHKETEEKLRQDQELTNLLLKKDFVSAFKTAFRLGHSLKLAEIIKNAQNERMTRNSSDDLTIITPEMDELFKEMSLEQVEKLLTYVKDWNTRGKWSHVSQSVIKLVLENFPAKVLLQSKELPKILDALVPYSERHFDRVDDLLTGSYLLDYLLKSMGVLSLQSED